MFDLDALLADLEGTLDDPSPQLATTDVLCRHVSDPTSVAASLAPRVGGIELLLHRSDLTVIHATWAPGMRLMPHDHRMWAVIAIYQGAEDNAFFRRGTSVALEQRSVRRLEARDVLALGTSTIHAVANPTDAITGAIHVYGGDFVSQPRSQWGPGDLVERPYRMDDALAQFHEANVAAGLE